MTRSAGAEEVAKIRFLFVDNPVRLRLPAIVLTTALMVPTIQTDPRISSTTWTDFAPTEEVLRERGPARITVRTNVTHRGDTVSGPALTARMASTRALPEERIVA